MSLVHLLVQLKQNRILLWVKSKENLGFSFDKAIGFPNEIKQAVISNKNELLSLLYANKVFCEEKAKQQTYLKLPANLHDKRLTSIQRGMYLQSQIDQEAYTYTVPIFIKCEKINEEQLKFAIKLFLEKQPHFAATVRDDLTLSDKKIESVDLTVHSIDSHEQDTVLTRLAKQPLPLQSGDLIKFDLIHINNKNESILSFVHHHMLSDAYSVALIIDELLYAYETVHQQNTETDESEVIPTFLDYASYQFHELESGLNQAAKQKIVKQLAGVQAPALRLRHDTDYSQEASELKVVLNAEEYDRLMQYCSKYSVTLYPLLLTHFYYTLRIYAGQSESFPLVLTVANRPENFSNSIGAFINTLPLVPMIDADKTLAENVKAVNQSIIELNEARQLNIEMLVDEVDGGANRLNDLLSILFTMHNFDVKERGHHPLSYKQISWPDLTEKFGLSLIAEDKNKQITFTLTYKKAVYFECDIRTILTCFMHSLHSLTEQSWKEPLHQLDLIDEEASRKLRTWNETEKDFTDDAHVAQLFERQVEKTPNLLALADESRNLTYLDYNHQANQLARHLINCGLKQSQIVSLCLNRSVDMGIAIMAILKAGCAYLPIDPNFPQSRVDYILENSESQFIICHEEYRFKFTDTFRKVICLDSLTIKYKLAKQEFSNLNLSITPSHLAYVIYTSGTTGQPKGVMSAHQGLINRIEWMQHTYPLDSHDKVLQKTPYVFDVSVWELLWANWYGASIYFARPDGHRDADYIVSIIEEKEITVCHFVPSMLSAFTDTVKHTFGAEKKLNSIKTLFCSGEALSLQQVEGLKSIVPHIALHNLYGPTEASIDVSYYDCNSPRLEKVAIGKPIDNIKLYILGEKQQLLPPGAAGELYIAGIGLAKGYLNKPELTAEKFIANPFQTVEESSNPRYAKLYKTGDLVYQALDGNIFYIGRNDFQVKIRGNRIELDEIIAKLELHEDIQQATILMHSEPTPQLVAYYISRNVIAADTLKMHLHNYLPDYMIPEQFIRLESFPVTINGKLDRNALPKPGAREQQVVRQPESVLEGLVGRLLSELLNITSSNLCCETDLYQYGLDSILSIKFVSKLRSEMSINISVKDIFSCKTICAIARKVQFLQVQSKQAINVEQGLLEGKVTLLPVQRWFFAQQEIPNLNHWNQAFIIKVPPLDLSRLNSALIKLVNHHDCLRLRYSLDNTTKKVLQYYSESITIPEVNQLDLTSISGNQSEIIQEAYTNWQSNFDLEKGPLFAIAYVSDDKKREYKLFFACHHLLIDTVSWGIICEDLQRIYEGRKLSGKYSSYRQWANRLSQYGHDEKAEAIYWQQVTRTYQNHEHTYAPYLSNKSVTQKKVKLDKCSTEKLLISCNQAYHTQINDLLITALSEALDTVLDSSYPCITLEGHGREEIDASLNIMGTVGWFTSFFPVKLSTKPDLIERLIETKTLLRQIPNKGIGFGTFSENIDMNLPRICFNYLGQIGGEMDSDWQISIEPVGDTMLLKEGSPFDINVYSHCTDGQLVLEVTSHLGSIFDEVFLSAYLKAINALIIHCSEKHTKTYTKCDFINVAQEADLKELPLQANGETCDWFAMTDIQIAYLVGRLGNYEIGNVANHIYNEYYYKEINAGELESAINKLIKLVPVLRTIYSYERLQQRFLSTNEIATYRVNVNDYALQAFSESLISPTRKRLSHQVYDAEQFPLFAFEISKFSDISVLHISFDLIILDVQSRLALYRLLDSLYRGKDITDLLSEYNFKDYQDYIDNLKVSKWYEQDKKYWYKRLTNMVMRPNLPLKMSARAVENPHFAENTLYVEPEVWQKFKSKIQTHGLSHSSALLSLFGHVLSYFSGDSEFLITLTLFNRYDICESVNDILGNFTSTVLFHYKDFGFDLNKSLASTHNRLWDDINHALFSGVEVQRALSKMHGLDQNSAVSPIVFTGVIGQNTKQYENNAYLDDTEILTKRYWCAQTSQAWIDLQAVEVGDRLMNKWLYVQELFSHETITHFNQLYCQLIKHVAESDWHTHFKSEYYLPDFDKQTISLANDTASNVSEETILSLLRNRLVLPAIRGKAAIFDATTNRSHSYANLAEDSDKLAKFILNDIKLDSPLIGVLADKGYEQVCACLAAMKTGRGYLPLHVDWPSSRIHGVLAQGRVTHLLVTARQAQKQEIILSIAPHYKLISIDEILSDTTIDVDNVQLPKVNADDVAYVIFTSGSTGTPKGVTISHRGAVNTLLAVNSKFNVSETDVLFALSELSFDLSVYDIFGGLIAGAEIVMPRQDEVKDPDKWISLLAKRNVSIWNSVPQLAELLCLTLENCETKIGSLRVFLMSGDWIPLNLPAKIKIHWPEAITMSLGGATEGSIWSIWYEINQVESSWKSIPYGTAMPNQTMYVLNTFRQHCPVNVIGEIYIGGVGVALNYWKNQTLTESHFIQHPTLGRLYRTGDFGKWNRDGYIEFLGRNDFQVKIGGHRIELGEIENALLTIPTIKQVVAQVKGSSENNTKMILAYYVAEQEVDEQITLAKLHKLLPEYMVPAKLIPIKQIPLSANGKVDQKALPEVNCTTLNTCYVAPRNENEEQLVSLWSKMLGLSPDSLSTTTDIFTLGVDSIISIQMLSKIRHVFKAEVTLKDIFTYKTIASFYDNVLMAQIQKEKTHEVLCEQGNLKGAVKLLPIQEWLLQQNLDEPAHWNQYFTVKVPPLDTAKLQMALEELVAYHDAFSLRFTVNESGNWQQQYQSESQCLDFFQLDVSTLTEVEVLSELEKRQHHFNLEKGPLCTFGYIYGFENGENKIFASFHHLIVDVISWYTLLEDIQCLYKGTKLPQKATSYRQWSKKQAHYVDEYPEELKYWQDQLPREDKQLLSELSTCAVSQHEIIEKIDKLLAPKNFAIQVDELLLTALNETLHEITGLNFHTIWLEGHGRETTNSSFDVSRTMGWFTTMYPVRLIYDEDKLSHIKSVLNSLRAIPNKGIGFGNCINNSWQYSSAVNFNYLGKILNNNKDWQTITAECGVSIDPVNRSTNAVNIVAGVVDDKLMLRVTSQLNDFSAKRIIVSLLQNIRKTLDVLQETNSATLLSADTDFVISQKRLDELQASKEITQVFLANSLQQGMLYHSLSYGDVDETYRVQAIWDYHRVISPSIMKKAWLFTQQQFASLRLRFDWQEEFIQIIDKTAKLNWNELDLRGLTEADQQIALEQLLATDKQLTYNLQESGLFRVYFVQLGEGHSRCIFNTYHAILDGWSSPILLNVLHDAYLAIQNNRLPEPVNDTYSGTQIYIQKQVQEVDDCWQQQLAQIDSPLDLSGWMLPQLKRKNLSEYKIIKNGARITLEIDTVLSSNLSQFAKTNGITLNSILQYAWHKIIAIYSGSTTTVIGTVVSGRSLAVDGIEDAVGLFLNTLPLVHDHSKSTSYLEQIGVLQQSMQRLNTSSLINLSRLQSGARRIFDSLFIYENYPDVTNSKHEEYLAPKFIKRIEKREYPLVMTVAETAGRLEICLDYAAELFDKTILTNVMNQLSWLLVKIMKEPQVNHEKLSLVEAGTVIQSNMDAKYLYANLPEVLEKQASLHPKAPALRFQKTDLSYMEFNSKANQLARYILDRQPIAKQASIAFILPRKPIAMIGLFAITKIGAQYVPLEINYPSERVQYIIQDSGAACVLCTQGNYEQLKAMQLQATLILVDKESDFITYPDNNLDRVIESSDPLYTLYTSGTTGKPKGVMLSHGAYLSTIQSIWQKHFSHRMLLKTYSMTNMVFDIFGLEYGLPLFSAGLLELGDHFVENLDCEKYDFIQVTPSTLETILSRVKPNATCQLLVGGEKLEYHLANQALALFSSLVNLYGPTETCIWSLSKTYYSTLQEDFITIGKPLPGESCVVLDQYLNQLPAGAIGELYLSGHGLAIGYRNQKELTASKFIRLADNQITWYQTGDLVRLLGNGEIEYIGRRDEQIKLRGYRIELGEIEAVLLQHEAIKQVTVQIQTLSEHKSALSQSLVAYYVSDSKIEEDELSQLVAQHCPDYMVPTFWILLPGLPTNANGKLDRKKLPVPIVKNNPITNTAKTELERELLAIWESLLGTANISLDDKFFEIGGNSILLVKYYAKLPDVIKKQITLIDLFKLPTINSICQYMLEQEGCSQLPVAQKNKQSSGDIAIIGLSGQYPTINNLEEFWQALQTGKELVTHYSYEELKAAGVSETQLANPNYIKSQSRLEHPGRFDAEFFAITPKEAELMDPQHRIFMMCVYHALEDANINPFTSKSSIGLYASVGQNNYVTNYILPNMSSDELSEHYQIMINNQPHFIATKTAYKLNLRGPAMTVQTACSSSLVSIHQACKAIQVGDCDIAVAGAISIGQLEKKGYTYESGMIFSPNGQCRPFDAEASGTIEGQGCGIVVLKSLESAIENGDQVHAVIKGSAINNDGNRKIGFTAPSQVQQRAVIQSALIDADVAASSISYIEAHGTGTRLGDPIEVAGLKQAYVGYDKKDTCAIGSIKGNLGHLDVAAGVTGLIKAVLCLKHRTLVPTLHFKSANPTLGLESSPFYVNTETKSWLRSDRPLRAGVSSFGIGGTNAHVILEEAPIVNKTREHKVLHDSMMLCLSAPSYEALSRQSIAYADYLADESILVDKAAYAIMTKRHQFSVNRVLVAESRNDLIEQLRAVDQKTLTRIENRSVVFMYPGQGAQYVGMFDPLYTNEPIFKAAVDECLFYLGSPEKVRGVLASDDKVNHTEYTQPALFVMAYALTKWYQAHGVQPDALIGHSLGEYVAACIAGVISLKDAIYLVVKRGELLGSLPAGAMLSVAINEQEIKEIVDEYELDIAVINDNESCVISGKISSIDKIKLILQQKDLHCRRVNVSHAFHSRMIEPVLQQYKEIVSSIRLSEPRIPFISNVTGTWIKNQQAISADYWVIHLRNTVYFAQGLATLMTAPSLHDAVFLEVGPSQILSSLARKNLLYNQMVVSSMPRMKDHSATSSQLLRAIGMLFGLGISIDADKLWGLTTRDCIKLPSYVFAETIFMKGKKGKALQVKQHAIVTNETNQQIVLGICREVLGVHHIDVEDNFFEIGGDSLTAVQYMSRIKQRFKTEIELISLTKYSVKEIVARLEMKSIQPTANSKDSLITLKQAEMTSSKPALILIHPIGGDIYFYREFADALPVDQAVYAIRSPLLMGKKPFDDIQGMASYYLELLARAGIRNSFCLVGASFGGIVAYEMAQQLEQTQSVPIVLIDTPYYGNLPKMMNSMEILDYLVKNGLARLTLDLTKFATLNKVEDKVQYLSESAKGTAFEEILSADFLPSYLQTWEEHAAMMHAYQPSTSRGAMLFFSHTDIIPEFPTNQSAGWQVLVQGDFKQHKIAGNHISMNAGASAVAMAKHLTNWLSSMTAELFVSEEL